MAKRNPNFSEVFAHAWCPALFGFFMGAVLVTPSAALVPRGQNPVVLGSACHASADPQAYAGKVIVDWLLIGDISPHGYSFQSRQCKLQLAVFWTDSSSLRDFPRHFFRMFYRPPRLSTEVGARLIEAEITGRVVRHKFPEGDNSVWALEVSRISNLRVAPEGYCAVNPEDWYDHQKSQCSQPKAFEK